MPSLAPLRGSALELIWGELIVLSGFGDIRTAFVHALVGIWISLGFLPTIAGLSPLMSETNILDFHNSGSRPFMCKTSFQIMCLLT